MILANKLIKFISADRLKQIDRFRTHAIEVQQEQFNKLIGGAGHYLSGFDTRTIESFRRTVPIVSYDDLAPQIEAVRSGDEGLLWRDSATRWLARSSGTTGSRSKFIPITKQYLKNCHYRGGKDVMFIFADNYPDSKAFSGKALTLGGSAKIDHCSKSGLSVGDLSAILIANTPAYVSLLREPKAEIALIDNFEQKVEAICTALINKNITSFAGVPSWNLVLMNKVLERSGKRTICDVWPDMSLFIHGGISFTPYRSEFERIIPSSDMLYMETYNASEGFFAIQDDPHDSSMLLMLDYDIFYEFLPMATLDDPSTAVTIEGVQTGVNYALILSTSCGLWRYMIGDTVCFTSTSPYKLKITGRTKHYINAFGEEIIIDNAERALQSACQATGASISDYTAAPIFMEGREKGAHEWLIEFSKEPSSIESFAQSLDQALQDVNSDYEAKRFNSTTLNAPKITVASNGLFCRWLSSKGKLGGQNKVPRLSNNRVFIDELLSMR